MTRHKWSIVILLALTLLLIGQAVYAQRCTSDCNLVKDATEDSK